MITLTGPTALRIYAQDGLLDRLGPACNANALDWGSGSARELRELEQLGIPCSPNDPVHVLVDHESNRIQSARVINHIWSGVLPAGSLYLLAPGVAITSAQLCYMIAARTELPGALAATGMECCGSYGRARTPRGFLDRAPLCTTHQLKSYVTDSTGIQGVKQARKALPWVIEGSRSPLETKTALLLSLPAAEGGYGLEQPMCNYPIYPGAREAGLFQSPYYVADLCWPEHRALVECDSFAYHNSAAQLTHDAMKRNSLTSGGWTCLSATNDQLRGDSLAVFAQQVAAALGCQLRQPDPIKRDRLVDCLP